MRNSLVTKSTKAAGLFGLVLLGCTDLGETPSSAITPDNFYRNEQEVVAGLAGVYSQMRNTLWGYYNLSQVSTDEHIVPTRGQDWFDNGIWLEIHRQTWAANSVAGLDMINGAWVDAFTGITRANALLEALPNVAVANKEIVEAEARTLRAFFYYQLMDLFGGVPIVTDTKIEFRPRATRTQVFDFIEDELLAAGAALPASWPAANHGRMTKGATDAVLANMYLNAGVFRKDAGVSATAYNSCTTVTIGAGTACAAAIAAADRILNAGVYTLATNWRSNFTADNFQSPENILIVKHLNQTDLGLNFLMRALHYNQYTPSPWNGFATLAETYSAFDADDQRRQIFLVGPQVNLDTGQPVNDRAGVPLVFTTEIRDATSATEAEGARNVKWPSDPNHLQQDNSNDFAYFRLGEMYLIKAEALLESGNAGEALALVNTLRARVFAPDEPLTTVDRDAILRERLFELTGEAKRRQDLIRFGKYLNRWSTTMLNGKQDRTGEPHRILMPIPQSQLDANPLLVQNNGY